MQKPSDYDPIQLPPGFRFHPTDEELISHYLCPKVMDTGFTCRAIGEVDLNKVEPWDLPWKAKMGEKEWYFFCVRDRKYPTGLRTNRATEAGYWKATGKDKEIFREKILVGMKKTLVFYRGRAPRGEKTNWVMHEYRLEGKYGISKLPKTAKNEWVICRVFKKSIGGKKVHITGLMRAVDSIDESQPSDLPALMDFSSHESCVFPFAFPKQQSAGKMNGPDCVYMQQQDQSILQLLLENNVPKQELSYQELGDEDFGTDCCLWDY